MFQGWTLVPARMPAFLLFASCHIGVIGCGSAHQPKSSLAETRLPSTLPAPQLIEQKQAAAQSAQNQPIAQTSATTPANHTAQPNTATVQPATAAAQTLSGGNGLSAMQAAQMIDQQSGGQPANQGGITAPTLPGSSSARMIPTSQSNVTRPSTAPVMGAGLDSLPTPSTVDPLPGTPPGLQNLVPPEPPPMSGMSEVSLPSIDTNGPSAPPLPSGEDLVVPSLPDNESSNLGGGSGLAAPGELVPPSPISLGENP